MGRCRLRRMVARGRLPEEPLRFAQQELVVHEGLVADVLPADQALAVDEERAVQRLLLEVVVAAIGLERFQRVVGHKRQRDRARPCSCRSIA